MSILVTGGTGYIGSHTCIELLQAGYEVIVMDNLSNSKREVLRRMEAITGKTVRFYEADLLDEPAMEAIFAAHQVEAVIHFAGLKAVGESVEQPLRYYHNNVTGTVLLSQVMARHGVKRLVFSSSATVYGIPVSVPISEDFPTSATNPYGRTKLMIEEILRDLQAADPQWQVVLLRYFNPIGAHESGTMGEDPNGIPNNLMPFITQVAVGKRKELSVFGSDYATHDGTGVRDYIHVNDLAVGHLKALEKLQHITGVRAYNLGTGIGYSVLDLVNTFQKATGQTIPYVMAPRRPGDIDACYADPALAEKELDWKAQKTVEDMCRDSWRWQQQNPEGYVEE
ncbi:UDP-glucose 4-epimerase GalE [Anoxynatronum sibiricum]|uniref:UDP-glucose 4-epimerase n=1 Tax=Anoxynatronum sibiricum TaxID=210623 RepID=A0ABU9VU02_9CLOT